MKKDGELIVTLNACDLYVRDLRTLCGRSWLKGTIISGLKSFLVIQSYVISGWGLEVESRFATRVLPNPEVTNFGDWRFCYHSLPIFIPP